MQVLETLKDPLQTLIQGREAEVVYAVLSNVLVLAQRYPLIFSQVRGGWPCGWHSWPPVLAQLPASDQCFNRMPCRSVLTSGVPPAWCRGCRLVFFGPAAVPQVLVLSRQPAAW